MHFTKLNGNKYILFPLYDQCDQVSDLLHIAEVSCPPTLWYGYVDKLVLSDISVNIST